MKTSLSLENVIQLFYEYSSSVWPSQFLFYLLAGLIIYLSLNQYKYSSIIINSGLAFFWLWTGSIYYFLFYSELSHLGYAIGSVFMMEGIFFIVFGVSKKWITYKFEKNFTGFLGIGLILYSCIIYPLMGLFFERSYAYLLSFILPVPITIFTFGMFLFSERKLPFFFVVIPFIWAILSFYSSVKFWLIEDMFLIIVAVVSLFIITKKEDSRQKNINLI